MNEQQENPRFEELIREVEEDLARFTDVLVRRGPSTVLQAAFELASARGSHVSTAAVRVRLDRLVEDGRASRVRSADPGRPYVLRDHAPFVNAPVVDWPILRIKRFVRCSAPS